MLFISYTITSYNYLKNQLSHETKSTHFLSILPFILLTFLICCHFPIQPCYRYHFLFRPCYRSHFLFRPCYCYQFPFLPLPHPRFLLSLGYILILFQIFYSLLEAVSLVMEALFYYFIHSKNSSSINIFRSIHIFYLGCQWEVQILSLKCKLDRCFCLCCKIDTHKFFYRLLDCLST